MRSSCPSKSVILTPELEDGASNRSVMIVLPFCSGMHLPCTGVSGAAGCRAAWGCPGTSSRAAGASPRSARSRGGRTRRAVRRQRRRSTRPVRRSRGRSGRARRIGGTAGASPRAAEKLCLAGGGEGGQVVGPCGLVPHPHGRQLVDGRGGGDLGGDLGGHIGQRS